MAREKYASLKNNPEIKRWFLNMSRGSMITGEVYMRRLGQFCEINNMDPIAITKMTEKEIANMLMDTVSLLESQGRAGSFIAGIMKSVKSWLSFNGISIKQKIKVKGADSTPSLKDEKIPSQEELKRIFLSGNKKSRVASSLMAFSGIRPEVLGSYNGSDGLKIMDFPEMEIRDNQVTFSKIPTMIIIRPELSKTRKRYFTFLGPEGCQYLKDYLEERMRKGEVLKPESPVITPVREKDRSRRDHIRTINIGDMIRKAIRKSGINQRPYVLRAYFDTQLMMAESKGLILRDFRQFFMGHTGDIEHRYTLNKGKLPENTIEEMRNSYQKSLKFLETENKGISESEMNKTIRELKTSMLILAGFSEEEIEKEKLLELSNEDLIKKIDEKRIKHLNNGNSQKVVSMRELKQYIEQGWEFVANINSREAIIRVPGR
jgi:integrase